MRELVVDRLVYMASGDMHVAKAWLEIVRGEHDPDALNDLTFVMPKTISTKEFTNAVAEAAADLLSSPEPARRRAGAEVLYGCGSHRPEDIRVGVAALMREKDPAVREALLKGIAADWRAKKGLSASEREEIRLLLSEEIRRGTADLTNHLAFWSTEQSDLHMVANLMSREGDDEKVMGLMCAFRKGVPLANSNERFAVDQLLGLAVDTRHSLGVRGRALSFLEAYAPFPDPISERVDSVRRAIEEARSKAERK